MPKSKRSIKRRNKVHSKYYAVNNYSNKEITKAQEMADKGQIDQSTAKNMATALKMVKRAA